MCGSLGHYFYFFAIQYLSDCEKSGNFFTLLVLSFHFHSFLFLFLTFRAPQEFSYSYSTKWRSKSPKCLPHPIHQFTVGLFFLSCSGERRSQKGPLLVSDVWRQSSFLSAPVKILAINNWRFRDHSDMSGFSTLLTNNHLICLCGGSRLVIW